jgi:molybdopterin-guanine dinucleotide biosynthesis protein A
VPRWRRGLEPAFAFYDAALLGDVDRALAGGERRLQALADLPGVRVLDLETPERRARLGVDRDVHGLEAMFMNLNTPAAIEEWEGRWRERGGPALSGAS